MIEREQSLSEKIPFLQYATGDAQIAFVLDFIGSVQTYVEDSYKIEFIQEARRILNTQGILPDIAIRLTISCFDYCLSDEIRKYAGDVPAFTDAATVYFRSDVYKSVSPKAVYENITRNTGDRS